MRRDKTRQMAAKVAKENPSMNRDDAYRQHITKPYPGSFDDWQTGWRAGVMAARRYCAGRDMAKSETV